MTQNLQIKDRLFFVRDLQEKDMKAVASLQDMVSDSAPADWFCVTPIEEIMDTDRGTGICVLDANTGDLAAFGKLIFTPNEAEELASMVNGPEGAVIDTIFVHKDSRGYGLQYRIIELCLEQCREKGISYAWATVHPDNVFSLRNLEKAGFTVCATLPKYGSVRCVVCCHVR